MRREMGFGFVSGVWMVTVMLVVSWAGPGVGQVVAQPDRSVVGITQPARVLSPVAVRALRFQKDVIREIAPKLDQSDQRKLAEMEAQLQALLDELDNELKKLQQTNTGLAQTNQELQASTGQLKGKLTTMRTELLGSLGAFVLAVLEITRRYFATKQLRLQVQKLQTQVGGG